MMGINRRRANWFQFAGRRKILAICVTSLVFYILFSPQEYSVTFDGTVPGVEPEAVWQFLADFNNIKKLNPTIENFSITSDNGDYYNWEYGVYYTEHLSNFPVIKNTAHAHYKVYRLKEPRLEYVIESDHVTCFIGRFFCVNSNSKFICRQKSQSVQASSYCREDVTYECPRLASIFCRSEAMYQRRMIFQNLILELASPL